MVKKPPLQHLVFASNSAWHAVPAERAGTVIDIQDIVRIPGVPRHVLGVVIHDGEAVPVIDLSTWQGAEPTDGQRAVVLRTDSGPLAVATTKVAGVQLLGEMEKPGEAAPSVICPEELMAALLGQADRG